MSTVFPRTDQALRDDGVWLWLWGLFIASLLLVVWLAWAGLAPLAVYEVTTSARLEVDRAVHVVEAPVSGRVIRTHLALGREVAPGSVLVELEATSQQLRRDEAHTQIAALNHQIDAFQVEIEGTERALSEAQHTAQATLEEARARVYEAEVAAQFAAREAKRTERMHERGFVSEVEWHKAQNKARQGWAALASLRLAVERQQSEHQTEQRDRQAALEHLRRERAEIEGERNVVMAATARMGHDIDHRRICAPIHGRLGDVVALQPGAFVNAGDKLASVVPNGALKLVADFAPAAALGRIRPGQSAQLRLDGFPWAQYGTVAATVRHVASEAQNGRVRVELQVAAATPSSIPMQHGLTGAIEVEVERITPARLALRTAGKWLATPSRSIIAALPAPHVSGETP